MTPHANKHVGQAKMGRLSTQASGHPFPYIHIILLRTLPFFSDSDSNCHDIVIFKNTIKFYQIRN